MHFYHFTAVQLQFRMKLWITGSLFLSQCAVIACFSKRQKQMENTTLHIKVVVLSYFVINFKLQVQKVIAI